MFLKKILPFLSFRLVGRQRTRRWLTGLFRALDFDLLEVAHHEMGINNYGSVAETGEAYFLRGFLSGKFKNKAVNIFDVGANSGDYSLLLNQVFPSSTIYPFEPNPASFKLLCGATAACKNIRSYSLGLGSGITNGQIYTYKSNPESEHASIIKNVMMELHHPENIATHEIELTDVDSFCERNDIQKIHFMKIDTEGYELEVLKGAAGMIRKGAIEVIQFEFNEMNVYSRVFLKDFYNLLPGYEFYRLSATKLLPLKEYNSCNEIFRYQNIVAMPS